MYVQGDASGTLVTFAVTDLGRLVNIAKVMAILSSELGIVIADPGKATCRKSGPSAISGVAIGLGFLDGLSATGRS